MEEPQEREFFLSFKISLINQLQEEILENSAIDYTICRAPMLSAEINLTGAIATSEGEKPANIVLSRNTAAEFFINIIENNLYIRETINLSNKPK